MIIISNKYNWHLKEIESVLDKNKADIESLNDFLLNEYPSSNIHKDSEKESLDVFLNKYYSLFNNNMYYYLKSSSYKVKVLGEFDIKYMSGLTEETSNIYKINCEGNKKVYADEDISVNCEGLSTQIVNGDYEQTSYGSYTENIISDYRYANAGFFSEFVAGAFFEIYSISKFIFDLAGYVKTYVSTINLSYKAAFNYIRYDSLVFKRTRSQLLAIRLSGIIKKTRSFNKELNAIKLSISGLHYSLNSLLEGNFIAQKSKNALEYSTEAVSLEDVLSSTNTFVVNHNMSGTHIDAGLTRISS